MALEDIDIYTLTLGGSPISGVSIGLYDNTSKAKLLTSESDATGKATFAAVDSDLNSGVYEIRVNPGFPGVVTGGTVQTVSVLEAPVAPLSNIFDLVITPASLPTATNPNLCRCTGFFKNPSGSYRDDVVLKFSQAKIPAITYVSSGGVDTFTVVPSEVSVRTTKDPTTGESGYAAIDLYRGGLYSVTMSGYVGDPRLVEVPDSPSANLADVLFPVVSKVNWYDEDVQVQPSTSPSVDIPVGTKDLTLEVVLRSGVVATATEVVVTSSDEEVVTVGTQGEDGVLTITGVAAGTASLEVARIATTESGIVVQSTMPPITGNLTVNVA